LEGWKVGRLEGWKVGKPKVGKALRPPVPRLPFPTYPLTNFPTNTRTEIHMKKKIKLSVEVMKRVIWALTILWMGIIFYFSSQPATVSLHASGEVLVQMNQINEEEIQNTADRRVWNLHYFIRKFAHFVLYCGLGFLLAFSIVSIKYRPFVSYIIAWLAASLYGLLDEWHQTFVPGRGATFADMRLDSMSALAGVVIAAVIIELWRLYSYKKREKYV